MATSLNLHLPESDETRRLALLFVLKCDLDAVKRLCRVVIDQLFTPKLLPHASWTFEAVNTAMVVRYGRCFDENRRGEFGALVTQIQSAPPELKLWHERAMMLRHGFYAHALDVAEKGHVSVTVSEVAGQRIFRSVGQNHSSVAGLGSEFARAIEQLCDHALVWVSQELESEKGRVREWACGLSQEFLSELDSFVADPGFSWERVDQEIAKERVGPRRNRRRQRRSHRKSEV